MLVDLTIEPGNEERINKAIQKLINEGLYPEGTDPSLYFAGNPIYHIGKGIYQNPRDDCNFHFSVFKEFSRQPFEDIYGVADNLEQILEYHKDLVDDPNKRYILSFNRVFQYKENAGRGGGWRWHKWGEYIGDLDPQCEYLDDEDFGDDFQGYVICFSFYEVP